MEPKKAPVAAGNPGVDCAAAGKRPAIWAPSMLKRWPLPRAAESSGGEVAVAAAGAEEKAAPNRGSTGGRNAWG